MKKLPNYSVLMSIYSLDNPLWLDESIESIMNQTFKTNNFVIVKDGYLGLELEQIIDKYNNKYPGIFNIISQSIQKGLGESLKIGVLQCKNEYIARMDSDDISVNDRIEKQLKKMIELNLDIVGSNIGEFNNNINDCKFVRNLPENDEQIKKYCKKRNPFGHSSVIIKKDKILKAGNYRPDYKYCEDYDLWIRMIQKGAKCYNFKQILTYMRVNKNFYKRRGGIKYLIYIAKFKKMEYKTGYFSLSDYIISLGASILVCLLPNNIRRYFYNNILRIKRKNS